MRNLGVAAIIVGILLIILNVGGVIGQGGTKTTLFASIALIVAGWLLFRRGPGRS